MDATVPADGELVYIDQTAVERGSKAPFFTVYLDEGQQRRYGYVCGNCDSLETAMDTMGRIVCSECGNQRKPDQWDAAHE